MQHHQEPNVIADEIIECVEEEILEEKKRASLGLNISKDKNKMLEDEPELDLEKEKPKQKHARIDDEHISGTCGIQNSTQLVTEFNAAMEKQTS